MVQSTYIWVRSAGVAVPPPAPDLPGEIDMPDFGDLGMVYANAGEALANRTKLTNYLTGRAGKGVWLSMGGIPNASINNKREQSEIYIDLASGPIAIGVGGAGLTDFHLEGPSKLIGVNAANDTDPMLDVVRDVSDSPRVMLANFFLETDGSGIRLEKMGTLTTLAKVTVKAGGVGTLSFDSMSDLDMAGYGLKIEDCDGPDLIDCQFRECGGHGVIIDRWHAGSCQQTQSWNNGGSGWKGQFINGTAFQFRGESNYAWGGHFRNCGGVVEGESPAGGSSTSGEKGAWECWFENNNRRDTAILSTGHPFRQSKWESGCARLTVGGRSGWAPNMLDVPNPVRVSNTFISQDFIDPSVAPLQDMKDMIASDIPADFGVPSVFHNWDTIWSTSGERPSVVMVNEGQGDQRLDITLPSNCYAGSTAAGDFWQPMGPLGMVPAVVDDLLLISAEISVDQAAVDYSTGNENASPRQTGWQFDLTIDPLSGTGLSGAAIWDSANTRKFATRIFLGGSFVAAAAIRFVISESQRFVGNQPNPIVIRIHDFKLYKVS